MCPAMWRRVRRKCLNEFGQNDTTPLTASRFRVFFFFRGHKKVLSSPAHVIHPPVSGHPARYPEGKNTPLTSSAPRPTLPGPPVLTLMSQQLIKGQDFDPPYKKAPLSTALLGGAHADRARLGGRHLCCHCHTLGPPSLTSPPRKLSYDIPPPVLLHLPTLSRSGCNRFCRFHGSPPTPPNAPSTVGQRGHRSGG